MAEWDDAETPQAAGEKMGLSPAQVTEWLQKYGADVIKDAGDLIEHGFSPQWVADTLENLGVAGPTVLSLILGLKKDSAKMGASPFSPVLVNLLVGQLQAILPKFLSGFELVAAQALLDALAKMLAAAG